jgi:arylformamidase
MPSPHDPAWFDTQYNNLARIADSRDIIERWKRASALARDRASRRLDLAYGGGPSETLDLFPTPRARAPVLVFIHGGYWRALDKSDHSFVAPCFVADGALVVVPNYALCPSVGIDQIFDQMCRAVAWVYRNAALYGGDPERIVVAGHSAGGQLAAMLLQHDWASLSGVLPARLVKGAMSLSGLHDLEPIRQTPFLQQVLQLTPALVRTLSPVQRPAPDAPLYAVAGALESEEFLRQNQLIRSVWGARAVPVCEAIPQAHHLSLLHDLADPVGRSHLLLNELLGVDADGAKALPLARIAGTYGMH